MAHKLQTSILITDIQLSGLLSQRVTDRKPGIVEEG